MCVGVHDTEHMWRSESKLWESVLSLMGSGNQAWITRLHGKCLYLLSRFLNGVLGVELRSSHWLGRPFSDCIVSPAQAPLFCIVPLGLLLSYRFKVVGPARNPRGAGRVHRKTARFFSSCSWPRWPLLPSSLHLVSPGFWQMLPSIVSSRREPAGAHPLLPSETALWKGPQLE